MKQRLSSRLETCVIDAWTLLDESIHVNEFAFSHFFQQPGDDWNQGYRP